MPILGEPLESVLNMQPQLEMLALSIFWVQFIDDQELVLVETSPEQKRQTANWNVRCMHYITFRLFSDRNSYLIK